MDWFNVVAEEQCCDLSAVWGGEKLTDGDLDTMIDDMETVVV